MVYLVDCRFRIRNKKLLGLKGGKIESLNQILK